jgi:gliding motility-associated-like protein
VFVGADQPHGHIYPPSGNSSVSGDTLFYTTTGSAPLNPFKVCYYVNSKLNENDTAHQVFGYYPVTEIVMNGAGQDSILIDSIQVYNGPTAVANGHHIVIIDQGDSTTLCSNVLGSSSTTVTATTYNWAQPDSSFINCPNCPCAVVTPSATTQYTLTLTDASGCVSSDTISVIVDIICTNIFVANAFTPNGDGLNDVLHVKTNCPLTNMSFKIFDRWGELVFQSTDESVGWDGTYKGKPMDMAVFMYTVNGFLSNGKEAKKKGNVTLLR